MNNQPFLQNRFAWEGSPFRSGASHTHSISTFPENAFRNRTDSLYFTRYGKTTSSNTAKGPSSSDSIDRMTTGRTLRLVIENTLPLTHSAKLKGSTDAGFASFAIRLASAASLFDFRVCQRAIQPVTIPTIPVMSATASEMFTVDQLISREVTASEH